MCFAQDRLTGTISRRFASAGFIYITLHTLAHKLTPHISQPLNFQLWVGKMCDPVYFNDLHCSLHSLAAYQTGATLPSLLVAEYLYLLIWRARCAGWDALILLSAAKGQ